MMTAQALWACVLMAANTYQVPPQVMVGIMHVEGGTIGRAAGPNINGTYDLGPMQVNTSWLPELSDTWHVSRSTAYQWVRDDGCVNVHVAAWILKQKILQGGTLFEGIARYHSATPSLGRAYAVKVVTAMDRSGLITHDVPLPDGKKIAPR